MIVEILYLLMCIITQKSCPEAQVMYLVPVFLQKKQSDLQHVKMSPEACPAAL
jgi:hypothetical protein